MPRDDERRDPTWIRDQPSLQTSSGGIWLVIGALLGAIAIVVFALLFAFPPHGLATVGIAGVVVAYAAMVIVRLNVRPLRVRLGVLAGLLIAMAVFALVVAYIIASTAIPV